MAKEYKIRVDIREQTQYGQFNDALYYTQAEFDALSEQDIEDAKQARKNAWVDQMANPPAYVEPSKEDLTNMKNHILEDYDRVLTELEPKLTKEELEAVQTELSDRATDLDSKIAVK